MKKTIKMKPLKKGQRCPAGWTPLEIKVGRKTRRACIRGKAERVKSWWEKTLDAVYPVAIMFD